MTHSEDKFDTNLPCDYDPFAYIEDRKTITRSKIEKFLFISYGALNHLGHYAPELGGVSVVSATSGVWIAAQNIPWDMQKRAQVLQRDFDYFAENLQTMDTDDIIKYLSKNNYYFPADEHNYIKKIILNIAEVNKSKAITLWNALQRDIDIHQECINEQDFAHVNEKLIDVHQEDIEEMSKQEEVSEQEDIPEFSSENITEEEPKINDTKNEDPPNNMVDGEELIPLD